MINTPKERAFLIGIKYLDGKTSWSLDDSLLELEKLAYTAGISVAGHTYQQLKKPHPATFIGKGKVEEIKDFIFQNKVQTVIFDDELTPGQQRNLENIFGEKTKVIDRTALILDIFARHAHTKEGQLQVELAQYEYRLPRLTRMWQHLVRQAGGKAGGAMGGVGLRGPGETQLESDRRQIRRKIINLKNELDLVRLHRKQQREKRKKHGLKVITLVGYTNSGKSSLLNALSSSHIITEDKLFATLDPTTKRVRLSGGRYVLFTDTVGFIKKLPLNLVAAFRATLEGITEADILVHVADISHPNAMEQVKTVEKTLNEQFAVHKPVLLVWNKIDLLSDSLKQDLCRGKNVITVSARTGQGLSWLLSHIEILLNRQLKPIEVELPYSCYKLINIIHKLGAIQNLEHGEITTKIKAFVPDVLVYRLKNFKSNVYHISDVDFNLL